MVMTYFYKMNAIELEVAVWSREGDVVSDLKVRSPYNEIGSVHHTTCIKL